jgi:iron complex outermembrane receptor protein
VTTAFGPNGLEDQATLPPTNPISQQLGATALQPELSTSVSFGVVTDLLPMLSMTLDFFRVSLRDRLSTTSALPISSEDIEILLRSGVPDATSFSSVRFFTNDFDSTTRGLDLVFNYNAHAWLQNTTFSLAYNWTNTSVDRVTLYETPAEDGTTQLLPNLTPQRIRMIEENIPEHRVIFTMLNKVGKFNNLVRLNYFSSFYEDHLDASGGLDIFGGSEWTMDLELNYTLSEHSSIAVGASNVFDNRPDINPFQDVAGARYSTTSPVGSGGGFYYLRYRYQY